ncbi:DsbA family oxidoreductase [Novosphingobium album (ex Liu et al. 2023)]|uniref:DsbA family oxidoreductase n=1 Tax=Novosphingobium album (ex Liu et al. 2023) TaxID=3031130 RepID=A0ABT5WJY7_9SPHN|nr:DsbA family oxidoreductase [Novosphingobium album (ex Liu et al. 2023)]MDE8650363.1 DsbA family oxidoreductase [Novosphingobium album (ex Liu et al. 2023)]
MSAPVRLSIDIWSDVMCPWCVIGWHQLQQALAQLAGEIEAEVRWRPFELNPAMPPEGEDMASHMRRKYGQEPSPAAMARMREIAARAGYDMRYLGEAPEPERRLWNTRAAHQLLHHALDAHGPAVQTRLKLALFDAYFQRRRDVSNRAVLLAIAESVGLGREEAEAALDSAALAARIEAEEAEALDMGITSVPLMLIERRFMIPGAQEPEVYVASLRKVAARLVGAAG